MLLATSLAALAGHLYTTLTLQAQAVAAVADAFKREQRMLGIWCMALHQLAHDHLLHQELIEHRSATRTGIDGATLNYRVVPEGFVVTVALGVYGVRGVIKQETVGGKNLLYCMAIEHF